jgi:histidyl-tRNA synthetase
LNTIGDQKSRAHYRDILSKYFNDNLSSLSPLSHERLKRGAALRILDSKEKEDQHLIENAPPMFDNLSIESKQRFDIVTKGLENLEIPYALSTLLSLVAY